MEGWNIERGARRRHTGVSRFFAPFAVLLVIVSLAACAPRLQLPGPPIAQPRLSDDAFIMPDGARLPLRVWSPEGRPWAAILALHGFNDYSNAFDEPAQVWAKHGIVTYAYDQRGFGAAPYRGYWAGTDAYVNDLRTAARLVRERHPGVPLFVLGESMGGAIVMEGMASAEPPDADRVILVAPAVWSRDFMPFYQTIPLWLSAHLFPWVRLTGEGLKIRPSDNIEMLRKFSADPLVIKATRIDAVHGLVDLMDAAQAAAPKLTVRTLILYGLKDEVVPDDPTIAMLKRLPHHNPPLHTIAFYSQGYHMLLRDLQAERVINDVMAWMKSPDRPLPSHADQVARRALGEQPPGPPDGKTHVPGLLPGVERP